MGIHFSWISVEKTNFMDLVEFLNLKQISEAEVKKTGEYDFVGYPCNEWYVFRSFSTFLHDKQMLNELSIKYKVTQGDVFEGDLSTIRLW